MSTSRSFNDGLVGRKVGMTHSFLESGECVTVTVVEAGPCFVLQRKSRETDGYEALQFGFEPKAKNISSPLKGHFSKAGRGSFAHVREVRYAEAVPSWGEVGAEVRVGMVFGPGERIDIQGTSKGKGFAGVVKRHKVKGQPATRGTHEYRRHIGAIGCRKFPGRVFKNQSMPGRMGGDTVTVQNLKVISIDEERNLLFVKGAVPGAKGSYVVLRKASKGR
jgi:large subunit ribosomal protein L3